MSRSQCGTCGKAVKQNAKRCRDCWKKRKRDNDAAMAFAKLAIRERMMGAQCTDCGCDRSAAMFFDPEGDDGLLSVGWVASHGYSLERLHAEMAKHAVRCLNCLIARAAARVPDDAVRAFSVMAYPNTRTVVIRAQKPSKRDCDGAGNEAEPTTPAAADDGVQLAATAGAPERHQEQPEAVAAPPVPVQPRMPVAVDEDGEEPFLG